jgi:hypothetical protein
MMRTANATILAIAALIAVAAPAAAQETARPDVPPEVVADLETARNGIGAAQADLADLAELGTEASDTLDVTERDVRDARDRLGDAREITATVRQRQQTWTDLLGALTSWIPGGDLMLGALLAALGVGAIPQTRRVAVQGVRAVRAGLDIQPDTRRPPHYVRHNGNVTTHAEPPKYAPATRQEVSA